LADIRVLHVISGLGAGGGAERSLLATASLLRSKGVDLHIVVTGDRQALVPEFERMGTPVHDISRAGFRRQATRLRAIVSAVDPHLVHASLFEAEALVELGLGFPRRSVPLLITWTGTPFERDAAQSRATLASAKRALLRDARGTLTRWSGAHVQAVTQGVADANSAALRIPASRVHVVERGRPPHAASPTLREATRQALGITDAESVALLIARHEPEKAIDVAIEAMAAIAQRRPELRLLVAGRAGTTTTHITQQVAAAGLDDRVILLGHRDDVSSLIDAADLLVSSSRSEGAAGAIQEALAASLPVVATRTTGSSGMLEDRESAILADPDDPRDLAAAIELVLGDQNLAMRIATGGRALFEQRFTVERSATALLTLYRELAAAQATGHRRTH
jgi:glycosyltransferase involved in cell wall biosynthesis